MSSLPTRLTIAETIRQLCQQIRWRPGRAEAHVEKRIRLGHLPPQATVAEYELLIMAVLNDPSAEVYLVEYGKIFYPTVVADYQGVKWLVMCGMDGIMETAFPPDDPVSYFQREKYHWISMLTELLA